MSVEPTDNRAERALREHVVQRKIVGTLRNEKGTSAGDMGTTRAQQLSDIEGKAGWLAKHVLKNYSCLEKI